MQIYANEKKLMMYIFPERVKIDKAQFILDRSGLLLKTCKTSQSPQKVCIRITLHPEEKVRGNND